MSNINDMVVQLQQTAAWLEITTVKNARIYRRTIALLLTLYQQKVVLE